MSLIDADKLIQEFTIRLNHYDKVNGDFKYALGIEVVMDYVKEMSTVEAIPVEWIEEYYTDITSPYSDTRTLFKEMIRKWERENE